MSVTKRPSVSGSWPTLLALVLLGLFWSLWGLLFAWEVSRWVGSGLEFTSVVLGALEWAALFVAFGLAHVLAAFGLRAGKGWAVVLAGVLGLLGLLALGAAARWLITMTVDNAGHFDIDTVSVWRFRGWVVIGIFGLLVLSNVVLLVTVARIGLGRLRTPATLESTLG